jgi:hypothetical protein
MHAPARLRAYTRVHTRNYNRSCTDNNPVLLHFTGIRRPGVEVSNVGGWHSDRHLFTWGQPASSSASASARVGADDSKNADQSKEVASTDRDSVSRLIHVSVCIYIVQ